MFFESLKYRSVNVELSIPFSGIQVYGWLFPAGHLANLSAQQSPSVWPAVGQGGIWITQGAGRLRLEHHQSSARADSRPGHPVGCGSHTSDAHQASPQAHTQVGTALHPALLPILGTLPRGLDRVWQEPVPPRVWHRRNLPNKERFSCDRSFALPSRLTTAVSPPPSRFPIALPPGPHPTLLETSRCSRTQDRDAGFG